MATLTATPAAHYQFLQWSDGNTQNPRQLTVTQNTTLTAQFGIAQHTVTISSNNIAWGTVNGGGTYNYGQSTLLTATPATGYHFVGWSDGNTNNPRVLLVENDVSLTATFAPNQYTVTLYSNDPTKGTVSGGGTYNYNQQIYIIASPIGNYAFQQWSDGNTNAYRSITVTQDISYMAIFTEPYYTVTVQSNNNQYGTATGGGTYLVGSSVTLTATANTGYHFMQWNDGNSENPRIVTVSGDATYTAQFAPNSYTLTVTSSDNTMGYASGGGTFTYGSEVTITATPLQHHFFNGWSDGIATNPRPVTVTSDSVITALFSEEPHYSVTVVSSNPDQGSVSGGGSFYAGEQTSIMALAASNFLFDHWNDGNTEALRTVTVTADVTYVAYFRSVTYTVGVFSNDDNMGTVAGGGEYEYGSSATVTATPAAGCRFVRWNNGIEINPYTFTVYSNVNLIATFERNTGIDGIEDAPYRILVKGREITVTDAVGLPIQVTDIVGRTIFRTQRYDGQPVGMPATGVYLIRINNQTKKVVIY